MAQSWTFDGTDLTTYAYNVGILFAPLSIPPRRADNLVVPGRTGRVYVPKVFDQRIVSLGMWVRDVIPGTGLSPSEAQLLTNLDALRKLFAQNGRSALNHVMGGVTRTVQAEVVNTITFQPRGSRLYRFVVEFLLPDPLWRASSATQVGPTTIDSNPKNITVDNDGTYRVEDAVFTITDEISAPRLTIGSIYVEYAGDVAAGETLVIDVGDFTAELDGTNVAGDITHDGDLLWLPIETGSNTLVVSANSIGAGGSAPAVQVDFTEPFI